MTGPDNVEYPAWYSFGPFRLDVRKRRLWRNTEIVGITPKVFDTLLVLVRNAGQVVEKEDLMRVVWSDTFVADETLAQTVSKLRKALGDTSEQPDYIATVPRRGYRFLAEVADAEDASGWTRRESNGRKDLAEAMVSGDDLPATLGRPGRTDLGSGRGSGRTAPERRWMVIAAASVTVAIVMAIAVARRGPPPKSSSGSMQFAVDAPPDTTFAAGVAISPDSRHLVFAATEPDGRSRLWLRALDGLTPRILPGTEAASYPFWAPDSRSIAFFTTDKLKRVGLAGSPPQVLADARWAAGGTWNRDGTIVFAPTRVGGLLRVRAEGGSVSPVTTLDVEAGDRAHVWPSFLPDGRHFLYRIASADPRQTGTYVSSIDSTERRQILDGAHSAAVYAPPGMVLFVRERTLLAQAFDPVRLRLNGPVVAIATGVPAPDRTSGVRFSAGANDVLAYLPALPATKLVWFSRTGQRLDTIEGSDNLVNPTLSPDDREIAAQRWQSELDVDIWLAELARGVTSRFATEHRPAALPLWSPDAREIAFSSVHSLYRRPAHERGAEELLFKTTGRLLAHDWSPDGKYIVFATGHPETKLDLWLLSLEDRKAIPYLQTRDNELHGQVSPDGRWIAYTSDESGEWEVYVQSLPVAGHKRRVSTRGGAQPKWRRDGQELFYLSADLTIMRVPVVDGVNIELGAPVSLFRAHPPADLTSNRNLYTATSDGKRFLVSTVDQDTKPSPIAVVSNWTTAVRH